MKKVLKLFVLMMFVSGWALAAAAVHVIRVPGKLPFLHSEKYGTVMLFPKDRLTYRETVADLRKWKATDLQNHPRVTNRLIEMRRADLLPAEPSTPTPSVPAPVAERQTEVTIK